MRSRANRRAALDWGWQRVGHKIPLLVNMQPAGKYLGEEFHRAGGVPAVVAELIEAGKITKAREP